MDDAKNELLFAHCAPESKLDSNRRLKNVESRILLVIAAIGLDLSVGDHDVTGGRTIGSGL